MYIYIYIYIYTCLYALITSPILTYIEKLIPARGRFRNKSELIIITFDNTYPFLFSIWVGLRNMRDDGSCIQTSIYIHMYIYIYIYAVMYICIQYVGVVNVHHMHNCL